MKKTTLAGLLLTWPLILTGCAGTQPSPEMSPTPAERAAGIEEEARRAGRRTADAGRSLAENVEEMLDGVTRRARDLGRRAEQAAAD